MKTLLIDGFGNITKEGLTIHFNQKFALNGGLATDEWYVSWDKIGKALCGDDYCEETEVAKLRELKKVNPVDAQVIICPDCLGTGKEICDSPDHGFRDAVGGVRLDGHANGCPCCGNDELHRIPNTTCNKCNGTGKL